MKMAQLSEFGISRWFIDRWRRTVGDELLDWQADAIRHFDLFGRGGGSGRNLIVIAPTSAGKTFLAELAMAGALMQRRRVVYVAPLKALAVQKYDHFQSVFGALGFRVVISTRDRRRADGVLRRGAFDVAVTVYEKWQNLLLTHSDVLSATGLVVFDEPQLLWDAQRGPGVAHIFDTMAGLAARGTLLPRALLLASPAFDDPSACPGRRSGGGAEVLAGYLNATIQRVHRRPVELRLGVLQDGRFHFREHNSAAVGDEPLPWDDKLPGSEQAPALLSALAERGERILVFCPSKAECHRRAERLAAHRPAVWELADEDIWHLESGPSFAPVLREWLVRGIGVHHADLTPHQRALIESLFAAGHVAVVFCTGTLAWGVNLPATMVFVDAQKYASGSQAGRMVPIPLERVEFEGMAGRAGRLGMAGGGRRIKDEGRRTEEEGRKVRDEESDDDSPSSLVLRPPSSPVLGPLGRGILWGRTPCEADLLWRIYIAPGSGTGPGSEAISPSAVMPSYAPVQRLLHWVAAGLVRRPAEARELAARSPFGEGGGQRTKDQGSEAVIARSEATKQSRGIDGGVSFGSGRDCFVAHSPAANSLLAMTNLTSPSLRGGSPAPRDDRRSNPVPTTGYSGTLCDDADVWDDAAARLLAAGMAQVDGEGCLAPTPRGSKTASAGLSVRSASAIVRALCACAPVIGHDVAVWTAFLASLPEMADTGNWTLHGRGHVTLARVDAEWRERFGEGFLESAARRFPGDPGAVTVHFATSALQQRAMVTALVMEDWAAGMATRDLERHYHLPIGRLEPAADALGWLFETTAALAETVPVSAMGGSPELIGQLRRAAFEIGHGMRQDAAALIDVLGGLLPRQTLLDLIARGWDDPIALSHRQRVDLAGIAPPGIVEEILRRCRAYASTHISNTPSETETGASTGSIPPSAGRGQRRPPLDHRHNSKNAVASETHGDDAAAREDIMSPILHLNGAPVPANGGRMSIELAGRPLTLRLKSFKYLLALAAARCLSRDGWIAKTDIEAGENQIKYLYQLRRELAAAAIGGSSASGGLIENDGNGHYRLTLPPQALRFDLPRLAEHSDWDIRTLAQRLLSTQAAAA